MLTSIEGLSFKLPAKLAIEVPDPREIDSHLGIVRGTLLHNKAEKVLASNEYRSAANVARYCHRMMVHYTSGVRL